MPENGPFDPRYSPEFQRGYDPKKHGGEAVRRADAAHAPAPAPAPAPAAARRVPPAPPEPIGPPAPLGPPAPQAADEAAAAPRAAAVPAPAPASVDDVGEGGSPASAVPGRSVTWRNPYVIVLLVLGVLLTASGVQLYYTSTQMMFGFTTSSYMSSRDLVTPQVLWGLAPVMLTCGVLTLVGTAFLAASQWRSRRTGARAADDARAATSADGGRDHGSWAW
ncbi:hypothetical protein OSC27_10940 [Microbacterium sp. STN6]|uniref:hypothetical protein n=1 Tax=Microbacterium sp. STN6 TaxID=2995588 RepID=UPI00226086A2|nr:hypothetical protein [Microbacterium sp. STN6]MCX7522789.1 hypothetical protein [Microbacterium sp. STN6]